MQAEKVHPCGVHWSTGRIGPRFGFSKELKHEKEMVLHSQLQEDGRKPTSQGVTYKSQVEHMTTARHGRLESTTGKVELPH